MIESDEVGTGATFTVAALSGDGIGPEVTEGALRVLRYTARRYGIPLRIEMHEVGWAAVQATGSPLPAETRQACRDADAVFLGAVGHPDSHQEPPDLRPEAGLLALRRALGCYANLRPVRVTPALISTSPLRRNRVEGTDLLFVRELSGGLYYGEPRGFPSETHPRSAWNTMRYQEDEIARVARVAFRLARDRRGHVVSVDKANVLETSRLWRDVVTEVAGEFPEVRLDHMLVDRAAFELVLQPNRFDVILTANLFGDILSDQGAGVAGSLGLLPSASLGEGTSLFEPVHGSAPELAGSDRANPVAAILSMALLVEHALGASEAALAIDQAVDSVLSAGIRTPDLALPGASPVGTAAFVDHILARLADVEVPA